MLSENTKNLMREYEQKQGFFLETGFESDYERAYETLERLADSDRGILIEKEHGYIVGVVCPYVCNPAILHAQEMGCYSNLGLEEDLREEFDNEAQSRGCKFAVYSCYYSKEGSRFRKYE